MFKVISTEKGILIPNELMDLPFETEFSIHIDRYCITLEVPTNKKAGQVRIGEINLNEEIGRIKRNRVNYA